jgi:hypothetical protein
MSNAIVVRFFRMFWLRARLEVRAWGKGRAPKIGFRGRH